ncbi:conserved hypothetical protein [Alteromonas sp. 38]|nr:conserved hypothetical protein [Alteromonas sp. 154]VXC18069.1 conserved hypothetical protein [Alteromonas sp. 38]
MDCLKLFFVFWVLNTFSINLFAKESCMEEKAAADHWNGLLRDKVTELRRSHHREAKAQFLACLGSEKNSSTAKSSTPTQNYISNQRNPKREAQPSLRNYPTTRNVLVSSYHNFKGAKKVAWNNFYKETPECINNSDDMAKFVKCASERKDYLQRFNLLWDDDSRSLKIPIN